ncbi:hypothetical protein E4U52_000393 [Claviceps spartinae]|nr:hypothetical protein E4U52_000393 [Claviceps spartinae]
MPRMSTRSSAAQSAPARGQATRGRATRGRARNASGQDPNPPASPPPPPAPSIDLQTVERQELLARHAAADAAIAQSNAAAAAAEATGATQPLPAQLPAQQPMPFPDNQHVNPMANNDMLPGEQFPSYIRDIARDLGSVAPEDISDVRSGKFEPMNLLRLHPARGRSMYETETDLVMDYSSGKIVFRKKSLTVFTARGLLRIPWSLSPANLGGEIRNVDRSWEAGG